MEAIAIIFFWLQALNFGRYDSGIFWNLIGIFILGYIVSSPVLSEQKL